MKSFWTNGQIHCKVLGKSWMASHQLLLCIMIQKNGPDVAKTCLNLYCLAINADVNMFLWYKPSRSLCMIMWSAEISKCGQWLTAILNCTDKIGKSPHQQDFFFKFHTYPQIHATIRLIITSNKYQLVQQNFFLNDKDKFRSRLFRIDTKCNDLNGPLTFNSVHTHIIKSFKVTKKSQLHS